MPRNMSFSMTTAQMRNRTKTVTRRQGWRFLKVGDVLCAIEKGQGLAKGEKVKRICMIRVVSLKRVPVYYISARDCGREGFPHLTPFDFIQMYCKANKCAGWDTCTRIEFEYLDQ